MTMHLVRGMSTTNTRKRKPKKKSKSLLAAEAAHQKYLEKTGIGKKKTTVKAKTETVKKTNDNMIPLSNNISGVAPKREANVYSGQRKLLGIATMHKSNMVPVFEQKDAEDIAKMRRG